MLAADPSLQLIIGTDVEEGLGDNLGDTSPNSLALGLRLRQSILESPLYPEHPITVGHWCSLVEAVTLLNRWAGLGRHDQVDALLVSQAK